MKDFLKVAIEAAHLGGDALKKYWGKLNQISHKNSSIDLVTEADNASEEAVLAHLNKNFPSHSILSEEIGRKDSHSKDFLWVVDPLDGTTNYTHQFPFVAISIALCTPDEIALGVVYNPILNELFYASKGEGATLNHQTIKVSPIKDLNKSLLASGFPYDRRENADNNYAEFCRLTHVTQGVRRAGAAALDLAYVAAGRLDGYWERGIKPWDIAAGMILVQEAGGKISNYENEPIDIFNEKILASNGLLHKSISQELLKTSNCLLD